MQTLGMLLNDHCQVIQSIFMKTDKTHEDPYKKPCIYSITRPVIPAPDYLHIPLLNCAKTSMLRCPAIARGLMAVIPLQVGTYN